ncbi:hypothetical protein CFP56_019928 [Quercus suber]|uniref:Uncharacterized protein n=1 Tax=Quercus suber TaxID=58331 RepID=A0AAW0KJ27_QUESU
MQTPSPSSTVTLLLLPKQRPTTKPSPKTTILHLCDMESIFFNDWEEHQSAQQLFQINAQTITPEALESVKAALASSEIEHKAKTKKKVVPRKAAGQAWEDPTLADWPKS